ncbi:hypothetical protein EYF80_036080 [Liparis tanakae]|uniref:Uncharacterized protein n=1 Tax=Liparis tanakae TaxID=230148 RepID=A0A4Z2GKM6_9TELE|nr:hypothetical protein EYF80_036080 [Liparis tanakae]
MGAKTVLLLSWGDEHNGLSKRHSYHLFGCHPSACELWENTRRSIPPVACLGVGAGQRGFVWVTG